MWNYDVKKAHMLTICFLPKLSGMDFYQRKWCQLLIYTSRKSILESIRNVVAQTLQPHFLATVIKPSNKEKLAEEICSFWSRRVPPENCQCYILQLQKVLPEVIRWGDGHQVTVLAMQLSTKQGLIYEPPKWNRLNRNSQHNHAQPS